MTTTTFENIGTTDAEDYRYGTTTGYGIPEVPDAEDLDHDAEDGYEADTDAQDDDQAGAGSDTGAGASARAKNAAKANRAQVRRTAQKTLEVHAATATTRALAAAVLGCADDVVEIATAVITAPRASGTALADLGDLADAVRTNQLQAGILAASLERSRLKAVWALLHALGAVASAALPNADMKAALATANAVGELSDEHNASLEAAAELIKRS